MPQQLNTGQRSKVLAISAPVRATGKPPQLLRGFLHFKANFKTSMNFHLQPFGYLVESKAGCYNAFQVAGVFVSVATKQLNTSIVSSLHRTRLERRFPLTGIPALFCVYGPIQNIMNSCQDTLVASTPVLYNSLVVVATHVAASLNNSEAHRAQGVSRTKKRKHKAQVVRDLALVWPALFSFLQGFSMRFATISARSLVACIGVCYNSIVDTSAAKTAGSDNFESARRAPLYPQTIERARHNVAGLSFRSSALSASSVLFQ